MYLNKDVPSQKSYQTTPLFINRPRYKSQRCLRPLARMVQFIQPRTLLGLNRLTHRKGAYGIKAGT